MSHEQALEFENAELRSRLNLTEYHFRMAHNAMEGYARENQELRSRVAELLDQRGFETANAPYFEPASGLGMAGRFLAEKPTKKRFD